MLWQCTMTLMSGIRMFDFMNFNENFINMKEKSGKIKRVNLQNDLYLANKKP